MISPAFILCSFLLLGTGSFAKPAEKFNFKEVVLGDPETQEKLVNALIQAALATFADVMGGKDILVAANQHGIEAFAELDTDFFKAIHSLLKQLKELQDGQKLEKVLAHLTKAIMNKQSPKSPGLHQAIKNIGDDKLEIAFEEAFKRFIVLFQKKKQPSETTQPSEPSA